MGLKFKAWVAQFFRRFVRFLHILLFVSGRVMAGVAIGFSLLIFTKRLYLVQNQSAWLMTMLIICGVAILNLLLVFPVFIFAAKMKCDIPLIKGVGMYLLVEHFVIMGMMLLTKSFLSLYTEGCDFVTWQGDPWWVAATQLAWLISWCTGLTSCFQMVMWGPGSSTGQKRVWFKRLRGQKDDSSVLTESKEGDEIPTNDEIDK